MSEHRVEDQDGKSLDHGSADGTAADVVLRLNDVTKRFRVRSRGLQRRHATAVDQVSLTLRRATTTALVGESGSGKSTTARIALGLLPPDTGTVELHGRSVHAMGRREFRRIFRPRVQAVFQDASSSLNPRKTVLSTLRSALLQHRRATRATARSKSADLLDQVGLRPGERFLDRKPHELSGGQLQRIAIARALAVRPEVIIADEPVSALDVSVRGQVLNLLSEIRRTHGISVLLITHDLSVVASVAEDMAVMYLGQIVEIGPSAQLISRPLHPYTQLLLAATPRVNASVRRVSGPPPVDDPPSAVDMPSGCRFHPRCPFATELCAREEPESRHFPGHGHVACHYAEDFTSPAGAPAPQHHTKETPT